MDTSKCKNCQHFRQHYTLDKWSCRAAGCGHCTKPRLKHRQPSQTACSLYAPCLNRNLPDRQEVIHFLTTEVLQFILQLELPPEKIE